MVNAQVQKLQSVMARYQPKKGWDPKHAIDPSRQPPHEKRVPDVFDVCYRPGGDITFSVEEKVGEIKHFRIDGNGEVYPDSRA